MNRFPTVNGTIDHFKVIEAGRADEFADLPEIRLAKLCTKCGLDQECLSLQEIAAHGESEHHFHAKWWRAKQ